MLRCDGVIPEYHLGDREATPDDAREMCSWLAAHDWHGDILTEGETPAGDPAAAARRVEPWAAAGCTWWTETRWEMPHDSPERLTQIRERISAGPPH
ncbi:MAG TPA: hypothetical protein VGF84_11120 [Micromonosporaceae bacterium]